MKTSPEVSWFPAGAEPGAGGEVRTAGHTLLQGSWIHLVRDSSHGHDPPQGDYLASGGLS